MAQTTLFAFGLKKFVQHNGVKHEVVPAPVLNYDIQNPLVFKFKCGQRFSRGCARASHERTCKRRKVPPPVVALAPGPVAAGASSDVEMEEQPPGSLAPAPQLVKQPRPRKVARRQGQSQAMDTQEDHGAAEAPPGD